MNRKLLCVLDVNARTPKAELDRLVGYVADGDRRALSDYDVPEPGATGTGAPYDWERLRRAVERMGAWLDQQLASHPDSEVYITGKAPLPLFAQLGCRVPKFKITPAILNRDPGNNWHLYPLRNEDPGQVRSFFDVVNRPSVVSPASGRVAIFLSTLGSPLALEPIHRFLQSSGQALADVVEIRTTAPGDITPGNTAQVAREVERIFSQIPGFYPRAEGYAVFIAGPIQLAFIAGRALNPNLYSDVWLANYQAPNYELAVELPVRDGRAAPPEGDKEARRQLLGRICRKLDDLRQTLTEEVLSPIASEEEHDREERKRLLQNLKALKLPEEEKGDAFDLRVLRRELQLGSGLLQALLGLSREPGLPEAAERVGLLLVLHELYHEVKQGLRTANHLEIGRAGVVLEELDYHADAFALATLVGWELHEGGPRAARRTGEIAAGWIECALRGIASFDRLEQGPRLVRLYERRLRRYLIWALQRERAKVLMEPAQVTPLLRDRLLVELAPLRSTLDHRFDKVVLGRHDDTELFICLRGRLVRQGRTPGFDPGSLPDKVRAFDFESLARDLQLIVENHHEVLAPRPPDEAA